MLKIFENVMEDIIQFGAVLDEFIGDHPNIGEGREALEFLCDRYAVLDGLDEPD